MPVSIVGNQQANDLRVSRRVLEHGQGSIVLSGTDATIEIEDPLLPGHIYFSAGTGAEIKIGPDCVFGLFTVHAGVPGARIHIGRGCGFNGSVAIGAHEASTITLGDDCLLASDCQINSSDIHHIFDKVSGERINSAADVSIGERVWLAARVVVMKGTDIGADSVVGAASVVSGSFDPGSLIVGAPTRVVRTGIYWRR